jgi:hypothetical protein
LCPGEEERQDTGGRKASSAQVWKIEGEKRFVFCCVIDGRVGKYPPTSRGGIKHQYVKHLFCCFKKFVKLRPTSPFFMKLSR